MIKVKSTSLSLCKKAVSGWADNAIIEQSAETTKWSTWKEFRKEFEEQWLKTDESMHNFGRLQTLRVGQGRSGLTISQYITQFNNTLVKSRLEDDGMKMFFFHNGFPEQQCAILLMKNPKNYAEAKTNTYLLETTNFQLNLHKQNIPWAAYRSGGSSSSNNTP